jgi:hypothetical protein
VVTKWLAFGNAAGVGKGLVALRLGQRPGQFEDALADPLVVDAAVVTDRIEGLAPRHQILLQRYLALVAKTDFIGPLATLNSA